MKPLARVVLLTIALVAGLAPALPSSASHGAFATGDVFVAVGSSTVQWRHADGSAPRGLTTAFVSPHTTGLGQDPAGRLYATGYTANKLSRFSTAGAPNGTFGPSFDAHPESIVFDSAGNAYVGLAGGDRDVVKLNASGTLVGVYDVATEGSAGADRIDLSADQCTLLYTSAGTSVKRFDVCANQQLSNFAGPLPGTAANEVRVLPDGGALVADTQSIVRLGPGGNLVRTFDTLTNNCWVSVALDANAARFWAADACAAQVVRFDLASGANLGQFSTGTGSGSVGGVLVAGGYTAARTRGADLSVQVADSPDPVSGENDVRFQVTVSNAGPASTGGVSLTNAVSGGQLRSAGGDGWDCSVAGSSAACSLGDGATVLGAGETAPPVDVVVRVPEPSSPVTVTNTASVSGSEPDLVHGNDTAAESAVVEPSSDGTATGYIPPEGGRITTDTGPCTDAVDHTCGTATFPAGPGGIASLVEEPAGLAFCLVPGLGCVGNAIDVIVPPGYLDPANPIVFELFYDASVVPAGVDPVAFFQKSDLLPVPVTLPALPCPESGPTPLVPCHAGTSRDENGDVTLEFNFLSGDPKFQGIMVPLPGE